MQRLRRRAKGGIEEGKWMRRRKSNGERGRSKEEIGKRGKSNQGGKR